MQYRKTSKGEIIGTLTRDEIAALMTIDLRENISRGMVDDDLTNFRKKDRRYKIKFKRKISFKIIIKLYMMSIADLMEILRGEEFKKQTAVQQTVSN